VYIMPGSEFLILAFYSGTLILMDLVCPYRLKRNLDGRRNNRRNGDGR